MSVVFPVYHRNKITKRRIGIVVLIIASIKLSTPALSFFYEGLLDIYIMVVVPLYFVFIVVAYTKIFLVASKRNNVSLVEDENIAGTDRKKKRAFLKDFKLAKACCLVLVCFFTCFIPGPISYVLLEDFDWRMRNAVAVWAASMVFLNSMLNVSIFFWKNPMLRLEGKKTFKGLMCC